MPKFTIKTTYRVPFYRFGTYEGATIEEACRCALEDPDWSGEIADYECVGETYVTGIWQGDDTAHRGDPVFVPSHFDETQQRKADHFTELVEQLAYVARPMGISQVDFERWLPRAQAAVAKAKAIIEGRRDPDEAPAEHGE